MVLAYHVIMGAYGFWLPNDPRGSWSDFVRTWEILRFGSATKTSERRNHARDEHDIEQRLAAKRALRYPAVKFTGRQARAVGEGFAKAVNEAGYLIRECSILPEHVHMVVSRTERPIERVTGHLKAKATSRLRVTGLHPLALHEKDGHIPSPWSRSNWYVYLNSQEDIARAVRYVRENPTREGLPEQKWSFVRRR